MTELQKQLRESKTENEIIKRKIEVVDTEINRLIYALYGLTQEEIKIVGSAD
jgi:hypothetical protein